MDTETSSNTPPPSQPSQEWGFVDSTNRPINLLEAFSSATDVHADYYQDRATSATNSSDTHPMVINGMNGDGPSNASLGAHSLTSQVLRHLKYIDGEVDDETETEAESETDEVGVGVQMPLECGMDDPRSEERPTSTERPTGSFSHPGSASMQPHTPRRDYGTKGFSRCYKYQADLRLMTPDGPRTGSGHLTHMVFARPDWTELEELGPLGESSTADIQIRNLVIGHPQTTRINGHHEAHDVTRRSSPATLFLPSRQPPSTRRKRPFWTTTPSLGS